MSWTIETAHPVAVDSYDHTHPYGTIRDNTTNAQFVKKLRDYLGPREYHNTKGLTLDIGCAGGGLVKDLNNSGAFYAVGIEGSDINQKAKRAEWATMPGNLFTADATKPYRLYWNELPARFDCITAWEVLEHIAKDDLPGFFTNIVNHTWPGTFFICSVANCPSIAEEYAVEGIDHHRTQEGPEFWLPLIESFGFKRDIDIESYFGGDVVRWVHHNWCFRYQGRANL